MVAEAQHFVVSDFAKQTLPLVWVGYEIFNLIARPLAYEEMTAVY